MPMKQEYAQILDNIIDEEGNWKDMEGLAPEDAMIAMYYRSSVSENTTT